MSADTDKVAEGVTPPTKPDIGKFEHPFVKAILAIGVMIIVGIFGLYTYTVFSDKQLPTPEVLTMLGNWFIEILKLLGGS
jgi:hypothetical protein